MSSSCGFFPLLLREVVEVKAGVLVVAFPLLLLSPLTLSNLGRCSGGVFFFFFEAVSGACLGLRPELDVDDGDLWIRF